MLHHHVSKAFIVLLGLLLSFSASAGEVVTTTTERVIVTPVPAPKETVVIPTGHVNCFTVAAGWYKDVWVPEHRVCQYEKQAEGVAWVEGYWACDKHAADGVCTNWVWKSGRWVKTLEVY